MLGGLIPQVGEDQTRVHTEMTHRFALFRSHAGVGYTANDHDPTPFWLRTHSVHPLCSFGCILIKRGPRSEPATHASAHAGPRSEPATHASAHAVRRAATGIPGGAGELPSSIARRTFCNQGGGVVRRLRLPPRRPFTRDNRPAPQWISAGQSRRRLCRG